MNYNPYMKPASIETRTKNIDIAKKHFMKEIQWIKDNEEAIIMYKHKFLQEMYVILTSGNRRFTEKMALATRKSIIFSSRKDKTYIGKNQYRVNTSRG